MSSNSAEQQQPNKKRKLCECRCFKCRTCWESKETYKNNYINSSGMPPTPKLKILKISKI